MTYVGWRDVKAAMRYLDGVDVGLKARFCARARSDIAGIGAISIKVRSPIAAPS